MSTLASSRPTHRGLSLEAPLNPALIWGPRACLLVGFVVSPDPLQAIAIMVLPILDQTMCYIYTAGLFQALLFQPPPHSHYAVAADGTLAKVLLLEAVFLG